MNDLGSKKLEEIVKRRKRFVIGWAVDGQLLSEWDWLISTVREQDREIERLREMYQVHYKARVQTEFRVEKAEAELAAIREDCPCVKMQDHFKDTPREAVRFTVSQLINTSIALKKVEAEVRELRDTLVFDEHDRPIKLWELIERIEKAEAEVKRLNERLLAIHKEAGLAVKSPPSPIDAFRMLTARIKELEKILSIVLPTFTEYYDMFLNKEGFYETCWPKDTHGKYVYDKIIKTLGREGWS